MVLRLKRSTAGALVVPFKVLSRNNMTRDNVLCKNWYLLGEGKHSSHAHKTGYFTVFLAPGGGEKEDIFIIV